MLDNIKFELRVISDNKRLFTKLLIISMKCLKSKELEELEFWVIANFWHSHKLEIEEAFNHVIDYV